MGIMENKVVTTITGYIGAILGIYTKTLGFPADESMAEVRIPELCVGHEETHPLETEP